MRSPYELTNLSDEDLLNQLRQVVAKDSKLSAILLAHIAEVDARKLFLGAAYSSMFTYCVEHLHFAECTAYKRIHAARTARTYPMIFELVATGAMHVTGVSMLAAHLTEENHRELLAEASYKSKRAIEELIAARAPKPDAPEMIRKLPGPPPTLFTAKPVITAPVPTRAPAPRSAPARAPAPEPLSEDRFKIQFTASRSTKDKLETARSLLRHAVPDGNLEELFDRALDALLAELHKKKLAATDKPREAKPIKEGSRTIPAEVKRAVAARDGLQCTYVDEQSGRRCAERGFLEFQHETPFARGGEASVENNRLLCRAHNAHRANVEFGEAFIKRKRDEARAVQGISCPKVQEELAFGF